jgi:hypothetical protein
LWGFSLKRCEWAGLRSGSNLGSDRFWGAGRTEGLPIPTRSSSPCELRRVAVSIASKYVAGAAANARSRAAMRGLKAVVESVAGRFKRGTVDAQLAKLRTFRQALRAAVAQ